MRFGLFAINVGACEPLSEALIGEAEAAGIDRLIVYPLVPGDQLERTVRDLGARFIRR